MSGRTKAAEDQMAWRGPAATETPAEPRRYRAKVFKSGNSIALRLPAELGYAAGTEVNLSVAADGRCTFEPADLPKKKFNIDKVWGIGKHLDLQLIASEDRVFEHRPLLWDDPDWAGFSSKSKP